MNHDGLSELLIQIDLYVEELVAPPDPVLEAALRRSREAGLPEMHVSRNEGKLLQLLAEIAGARRVLRSGHSVAIAPYTWPAPSPRAGRWSPWSWSSGTLGSPARTFGRPASRIRSRCGLGTRRRCSPGWSRRVRAVRTRVCRRGQGELPRISGVGFAALASRFADLGRQRYPGR
jgi:hypothetical protein